MAESLTGRRVRATAPDDRVPHSYLVVADGRLLRVAAASTRAEFVAEVPSIRERGDGTGDGRLAGKELEVKLYVHGRWACVTERFGTNAALVDTASGTVRELSRADYHADVSSYSIGFLERDGRTLLLAQTRWNRLDVFDAETGANLTERPDDERAIDYFHSLLHVSPGSRHFLSNGWVWSPVDMVRVFSTAAFLTGYEPTSVPVDTTFGYNWDRPCAFVDDRTFVLALDDSTDHLDDDEAADYRYRQLAFFEIPDLSSTDDAEWWLQPRSLVDCDVFPRNRYGEVKGELHYDPVSGHLIALTDTAGAFVVTLTGDVVAHAPGLSFGAPPAHADFGSRYTAPGGWSYAPTHRVFYRWADDAGVEERALPTGA